MLDHSEIDKLVAYAATGAFLMWIALVSLVYSTAAARSTDETPYLVQLQGVEQLAPILAAVVLTTSFCLLCMPFVSIFRAGQPTSRPSGVIYAAMMVMSVAICTNLLLAFRPTVVLIDPVCGARVFLIRWCEWIPLAGLMTFMSDVLDTEPATGGLTAPIRHSVGQFLSALCGIVFPFCPNAASWWIVQTISMALYIPIFPRVENKRKRYIQQSKGISLMEKETYDRRYFSYHLLHLCAWIWTILVVMYYAHAWWYWYMPADHPYVHPSSAMVVDTLFDILAKSLYIKVIVAVHHDVFDSDTRARAQLGELRRLMQLLWDSTTDTIIISVSGGQGSSTFLSPSFQTFVVTKEQPQQNNNDKPTTAGDKNADSVLASSWSSNPLKLTAQLKNDHDTYDKNNSSATSAQGFLLQTVNHKDAETGFTSTKVVDAKYIDSSHISSSTSIEKLTVGRIDPQSKEIQLATTMIQSCWERLREESEEQQQQSQSQASSSNGNSSSLLVLQEFDTPAGEKRYCELKVSQRSSGSFVAIVRDVTERHKRFEAEKRAHAEALARQKDAQNANRFTRHEIKNGLLSGIELCIGLQKALDVIVQSSTTSSSEDANSNSRETTLTTTTNTTNSNNSNNNTNSGPSMQDLKPNISKISGLIAQVDNVLHEILDTVLAEAMARDVIHECYEANPKKADLIDVLRSSCSGIGFEPRFPLRIAPSEEDLPKLMIDTQLLRFIHRNAVSNASKYGKPGGSIATNIHYQIRDEKLTLEVVNEPGPGHNKLLNMGEKAGKYVFEAGTRLHTDTLDIDESTNSLSAGDGAWIMQKCAKTMGGCCTINFEIDRTVFRLRCPAVPVLKETANNATAFSLPHNTWALGIDDSWIQRKQLVRILSNAGISESRMKVIGKNLEELDSTPEFMMQFLKADYTSRGLVLVDENLDYADDCGSRVIRSGSNMMQKILLEPNILPPDYRDRILVLVRSANDSTEDMALYSKRTHGFFPKTATRKGDILDCLEPAWKTRFGSRELSLSESEDELQGSNCGSHLKDDLRDVLTSVDDLIQGGQKSCHDVPWPHLWSALHSLKGDIMISDQPQLVKAAELISEMRGEEAPTDCDERWAAIRECVLEGIDCMGNEGAME